MIEIIKRNQSYLIRHSCDKRVDRAIKEFTKGFTSLDFNYDYKLRKVVSSIKYRFVGGNKFMGEFLVNRNNMARFIGALRREGIQPNEITFSENMHVAGKIDLDYITQAIPRDYQDAYEEVLVCEDGEHAKLVDLQAGRGKTFIATKAISTLKERTILLLLPKYLKKWIVDLNSYYKLEAEDTIVVQGRDELVAMLNMDVETIPKFILISNRTFMNFIHEYEEAPSEDMFDCNINPKDICKHLDVGIVLVDEVHNELYSIFKALLYLDPRRFIGLSATFIAKDKTLSFIQQSMFNDKSRLSLIAYNAYAKVHAVSYHLNRPERYVPKKNGGRGYNHIGFEQIIMYNKYALNGYFKMIKFYIDMFYIKMKKFDTDKAIVFCSSVDMCTLVAEYLSYEYRDLNVKRFVADDPQENLYESDIRVTTIKSGGEAVDIPGLIFGLLSVAIDSEIANLQAIGRLREIKGRDVNYVYLWCKELRPHRKYHFNKRQLFMDKVKSMDDLYYPGRVD